MERLSKRTEYMLHAFFWLMVFAYPYIKQFGSENGYTMPVAHELNALILTMIPTYLLYYWFFPIVGKKSYHYGLAIAIWVGFTLVFLKTDEFFHAPDENINKWKQFVSALVGNLGFISVFFGWYSIKKMYKNQQLISEIEQAKQQAELNGLKAQFNPHFLFNTLNAIYASALKKEEQTPELILKMSDNFRYLTEQGQQNRVTIKDELDHLKKYIALQKARSEQKFNVLWNEQVDNPDQKIAPLLLIAFVENAFKYTSILKGSGHEIKINCQLVQHDFLFTCTNPSKKSAEKTIDKSWGKSGIGIKNTKQRLSLLYGDKQALVLTEKNNEFSVRLTINLE